MNIIRGLADVLDAEFRSNPAYVMVPLTQLSGAEEEFFARLRDDPDCFGLLRPRKHSSLRLKSICRETAALFQILETPGKIPAEFLRRLGERANEQIMELVLDDVLQISHDRDFLSGVRAYNKLYSHEQLPDKLGRIATLSLEAIRYAQWLPIEDPIRVSAQLYFYNRVPVTPQWARRIGDSSAFMRFLGIDDISHAGQVLRSIWKRASSNTPGWSLWLNKSTLRSQKQRSFRYKLYLSPTIESMTDYFPKILDVFADEKVARFKFGSDLAGLMRPDKLVAYFSSFDSLEKVARIVESQITGAVAHGVPFTAEISEGGLLSWGIDPREDAVIEGSERTSWRLWITHRLAGALLDARNQCPLDVEPWKFALDRMVLDGIDINTWTPMHIDKKRAWS